MSIFNKVPTNRLSRSVHNLSHENKLSFDFGGIYPVLTELVMPKETWSMNLEQFVRSMPLLSPVMHRCDVKVDAFYVPLRLVWDDFVDFITKGSTGEFTAAIPTISYTNSQPDVPNLNKVFGTGGLADYLNFASVDAIVGSNFSRTVNALPFRAYQLIFNEYFRNESLDSEIPVIKASGSSNLFFGDTYASDPRYFKNFIIQNRGWRKDYFTSALPDVQKGPDVVLPNDVEIERDGNLKLGPMGSQSTLAPGTNELYGQTPAGGSYTAPSIVNTNGQQEFLGYEAGLKGQLEPITIESLRWAEVLSEYYEAQMRGGNRYPEWLSNIWHVRSSDASLQRPQYLGGYRGPITISEIPQTSESNTSPQGTLAGKGVSAGGARIFRKRFFEEFGIVMVTMSVIPKSAYFQGDRRWTLYEDALDFPNPFFGNLGEQAIKNQELYYSGVAATDADTFGYAPRMAEMKFIPDSVHGQLRSSLNYWHLARKFDSLPNLNSSFVKMYADEAARIWPNTVSNNDKLIGELFFKIKAKMPLPYYGVPRLNHNV